MCACMYPYMYVSMPTRPYVYVSMYVCMYPCTYVCIHVRMYVNLIAFILYRGASASSGLGAVRSGCRPDAAQARVGVQQREEEDAKHFGSRHPPAQQLADRCHRQEPHRQSSCQLLQEEKVFIVCIVFVFVCMYVCNV